MVDGTKPCTTRDPRRPHNYEPQCDVIDCTHVLPKNAFEQRRSHKSQTHLNKRHSISKRRRLQNKQKSRKCCASNTGKSFTNGDQTNDCNKRRYQQLCQHTMHVSPTTTMEHPPASQNRWNLHLHSKTDGTSISSPKRWNPQRHTGTRKGTLAPATAHWRPQPHTGTRNRTLTPAEAHGRPRPHIGARKRTSAPAQAHWRTQPHIGTRNRTLAPTIVHGHSQRHIGTRKGTNCLGGTNCLRARIVCGA